MEDGEQQNNTMLSQSDAEKVPLKMVKGKTIIRTLDDLAQRLGVSLTEKVVVEQPQKQTFGTVDENDEKGAGAVIESVENARFRVPLHLAYIRRFPTQSGKSSKRVYSHHFIVTDASVVYEQRLDPTNHRASSPTPAKIKDIVVYVTQYDKKTCPNVMCWFCAKPSQPPPCKSCQPCPLMFCVAGQIQTEVMMSVRQLLKEFGPGNLFVREYEKLYPSGDMSAHQVRAIRQRIAQRDGEVMWRLTFNNCEHYANFIMKGEHKCDQIEDMFTEGKQTAGFRKLFFAHFMGKLVVQWMQPHNAAYLLARLILFGFILWLNSKILNPEDREKKMSEIRRDAGRYVPIITGIYELCFFIAEAFSIMVLAYGCRTCCYPYKPQNDRRPPPVVFRYRAFGWIQLIGCATGAIFEWCAIVDGLFLGHIFWGHWPWFLGELLMTIILGAVLHTLWAVWMAMLETQYYLRAVKTDDFSAKMKGICWFAIILALVINVIVFGFCCFVTAAYWDSNALEQLKKMGGQRHS